MSDEDMRPDMRPDSVRNKIRIENLERDMVILNENLNTLEASYTNSMKLITASLERLLRRIRKLES